MLMTHEYKSGIDFSKVEVLRRHMWLSVSDMAAVLGVSRITYYTWVRGGSLRATRVPKVKARLKKLLAVAQEKNWPDEKVRVMTSRDRLRHLLDLIEQEK